MHHEKRKKHIEDLVKEMPELYEESSSDFKVLLKVAADLEKELHEGYQKDKEFVERYSKIEINGYTLVNTHMACPEQYDVFKGNEQAAYFRVRHGLFSVRVPDVHGDTVYTAEVAGDGCFMDDERDFYLRDGIETVEIFYNGRSEQDGVY